MRAPWLLALVAALVPTTTSAQSSSGPFEYIARTVAPVARRGAVTAGSLTWRCVASECHIRGPWLAPGVPACVALAGQVGRIASYGRTGAMLNAAQLEQCNANVPVTTMRIDPNAVRRTLPPAGAQIRGPVILGGGSSAPTPAPAPAAATSEVGVEMGGRPEDIILHVLSLQSLHIAGVTPELPAPTLPDPVARISAGRIDTLGVRLQASAPGASTTPREVSETPVYRLGATGAVILRVPVSLRDMPAQTYSIDVSCNLLGTRYVPPGAGDTPPYRDLYVGDGAATPRQVARGEGGALIRNVGRFETTLDIPMQLRPHYRLEDARSYVCAVRLSLLNSRGGLDHPGLNTLVDPAGPPANAAFRAAAGTTAQVTVRGNLQ